MLPSVTFPAVQYLSTLFHLNVFRFSVQICTEIFLILRKTKRDTIVNAHSFLCKLLVILM